MENKIKFLGIDIGGAHLKLVGTNTKKKIVFHRSVKPLIFYFGRDHAGRAQASTGHAGRAQV